MELIIINSHPIQYFAPLYRFLVENSSVEITVCYLSKNGLVERFDSGFNRLVAWDVPLLDGYNSIFFKNISCVDSVNSFWGLINPSLISFLLAKRRKIVWVHGWNNVSQVLAIVVAKLSGHIVCLRGESTWHQEKRKAKLLTKIKHFFLRRLFSFVDYFLFIGTENRKFYENLGVSKARLYFFPYSVNNEFFKRSKIDTDSGKKLLGIDGKKKILLFSGKFISKKRPFDLLYAFTKLKRSDTILVMMGDGVLQDQMKEWINTYDLNERVILTGFVNQSMVPNYYSIADVFVMCSGIGETWGLSVNEAMNYGVPIVVSNTCGCASDLVKDCLNGFIFKEGDIEALSIAIEQSLNFSDDKRKLVREVNESILSSYSFKTIQDSFEKLLYNCAS